MQHCQIIYFCCIFATIQGNDDFHVKSNSGANDKTTGHYEYDSTTVT